MSLNIEALIDFKVACNYGIRLTLTLITQIDTCTCKQHELEDRFVFLLRTFVESLSAVRIRVRSE